MIIDTLALVDKIKKNFDILGIREMVRFNKTDESRYYLITKSEGIDDSRIYWEGFRLAKNIYDYLRVKHIYKTL